ncbi:MAG: helix-turn-helix transcriptional regulator [Verrucomicrobiota bacterium]|nr:helix-turn-helix transcriptional regulator [Verrucomicrobiota bacterium]
MEKDIQELQERLGRSLSNCTIEIDAPERPEGNTWLDFRAGKKRLTIEYRPQQGFGIFHGGVGYGEGPAEIYRTAELAARRVVQLLRSNGKRSPLTPKQLRELYNCSQVELARKVGVKQSAISRFEHRGEVKLGTLAAAVKALGGELEVRARFADSNVAISVID